MNYCVFAYPNDIKGNSKLVPNKCPSFSHCAQIPYNDFCDSKPLHEPIDNG